MSACEEIVDYRENILNQNHIDICVKKLQELVFADIKLKTFRTDCSYILRVLHCTGFNVAAALKKIQTHYNHVCEHPEWYASTSPLTKNKEILESGKVMLLERDKQGRRIFVIKLGEIDVSKTSFQEQDQIEEIWMESVLDDPKTQAAGIAVIMDMKGFSAKLLRWLTPSNMKNSAQKSELYPCKEIVYHIVNMSGLINVAVKLMWPFLGDETKKTVKFHTGKGWSSLHEHISPDLLPPEYGGTAAEIDYEALCERLFDQDAEIYERLKFQQIPKH